MPTLCVSLATCVRISHHFPEALTTDENVGLGTLDTIIWQESMCLAGIIAGAMLGYRHRLLHL